ncbi:MAG: Flagellar hook protein FlgE [Bacteriovoracaceae bacterium]|nr:Flagellar hook protein FlgE [Bacteriovoracaceae bacterium]
MSVTAALYSGVSGITSNGDALSVSGDNIANISTPAFKASAAIFESALTQTIGGAQIGLGSRLAATSANFTQGAFAGSSKATDLAIQGKGFFVVKSAGGQNLYTRAGSFSQDRNGNLVTDTSGANLQGYSISESGVISGSLSSINVVNVTSSPAATTKVQLSFNLDASQPTAGAVDTTSFSNAAASSQFNMSATAHDSLGNDRTVVTYFRKVAANQWSYHVLTDGANLANFTGTGTAVIQEGLLNFNSSGALTSVTNAQVSSHLNTTGNLVPGDLINPALTAPANEIQWAGGASASGPITFDFGQIAGSVAKSTQYSAPSAPILTSQDGRANGSLQSINFSADGHVSGSFSNGVTRDMYKIPLATFANDEGLTRAGSNTYVESDTSGTAQIGDANASGRGSIKSNELEQSNTDLAGEFVKIITYQRGFQASSRTIQVAAELLQDLVQLGR